MFASTSTLADADNASNPPTALPLIIDSTVIRREQLRVRRFDRGPGTAEHDGRM
jgi:hypothetical protein